MEPASSPNQEIKNKLSTKTSNLLWLGGIVGVLFVIGSWGSWLNGNKVASDVETGQVQGLQASVAPTPTPSPSVEPSPSPSVSPSPSPSPSVTPTPKPTVKPKASVTTQIQTTAPVDAGCGTYVNSAGNTVARPCDAPSVPSGATAKCGDGTYSYSQSRRGTCSHHGGVAVWY